MDTDSHSTRDSGAAATGTDGPVTVIRWEKWKTILQVLVLALVLVKLGLPAVVPAMALW